MTYKISAGVYVKEIVKNSGALAAISGTIGCGTFGSKKGPLGRTLITGGYEEFVRLYGESDTSWSPAHLTLKPALSQMTVFYGNRVVNGAKYAGLSLYYDRLNSRLFSQPFATGTSGDYQTSLRTTYLMNFSNYLASGDTVTVDVGETPVTQEFANTSNYTLGQLAIKIKQALDTLGEGGDCTVIKAWTMSDRKQSIVITFSREFKESDSVAFNVSAVGVQDTQISQTFETDSTTTLDGIISKLNGVEGLAATSVPGQVPAIKVTCTQPGPSDLKVTNPVISPEDLTLTFETTQEGHGVYDDRELLITLPETIDSLPISGSVEGSAVEIELDTDCKVLDIFAENPGQWASDLETGLGIRLNGLDAGISQRLRLTISKSIVAGQQFECSIGYNGNTYNIEPVQFATSSDDTLQAIAQQIQTCISTNIGQGSVVTVEHVPGGTENDRSITVVGPNPDVTIEIDNAMFIGDDSVPLVTVSEVIPNTPSNKQFNLEVYSRESIVNPLESWTCSLNQQVDSNGNSLFIEDRINQGSYKSENIRVVVYTNDYSKLQPISSIAWLGGGDDGMLPTTAQLVEGWDQFADPEQVTVRLLLACGYNNVDIHQKISTIAKNRKDCVALMSIPSDKQDAEGVVNYRQYEMNVNTSYAAVYSPDIVVFDDIKGVDTYVSPEGYAAASICYTERNWAIYWAAAGLTRGICDGAKGVRFKYNEGQRDLIEQVHVNPVRDMGTSGIVIMGEYTAQSQSDPLTDLHVRLLVNNISIYEADSLKYFLFDPNDEYMRAEMVKNISGYLQPIKDGRGIRQYQVVSDINTENPADVDLGAAQIKVAIWPTSSTKYIEVTNIINGMGVSVEEAIG